MCHSVHRAEGLHPGGGFIKGWLASEGRVGGGSASKGGLYPGDLYPGWSASRGGQTPFPRATMGYSQRVGSTHPTGMHSNMPVTSIMLV